MDILSQISPTTWTIILAAGAVAVLVIFAKAIKNILKLAVIAGMALVILYFLRQTGLL